MRLNHFDLVGNAARPALELAFEPAFSWYAWFLRWGQSPSLNEFQRHFSRLALAQLPSPAAADLSQRVTTAITFWRGRLDQFRGRRFDLSHAVERLRLFLAALARLTIRQEPAAADASFALAIQIAADPRVPRQVLAESISDLAKFSALVTPPARRTQLVLPALEFPLSSEANADPYWWPNPIQSLWMARPERPATDPRWNIRIEKLIQSASAGQQAREQALLRLAYLAIHNALLPGERESLAQALWSERDDGVPPLPKRTGLSINVVAKLPAPAGTDAEGSVRTRLFDASLPEILAAPAALGSEAAAAPVNYIRSVVGAAQDKLSPTPEQAVRLFDQMAAWRPATTADPRDPLGASLLRNFNDAIRAPLGDALSLTIAPSMDAADRTKDRARALLALVEEASVRRVRAALPLFAPAGAPADEQIVQSIRRGLTGPGFDDVAGAAAAVETWVKLEAAGTAPPLPDQIIERVISGVETRFEAGLTALLHCCRRMAEAHKLSPDHFARISAGLGDLLVEAAYDRIDPESRAAVSVSLIRAECIRLARTLEQMRPGDPNASAWLEVANTDPLPEVRFALDEGDD